VRCPKRGKRVPAVPMRLHKGQKPAAGARWTEASIWTERMVSALVNGVKAWPRAGRRPDPWGGKWFSLIDKVYRPSTLAAAWTRVERNKGRRGLMTGIERFAAQAERYLTELHEQLKDGSYRPAPVNGSRYPRGRQDPPAGHPTVKSLPERKRGPGGADGAQTGH